MNMRKLTIGILCFVLFGTAANAQKFEGGENNLEVQFLSPFNSSSPFGLINGIRYRKFTSSSSAVRVHVNVNYNVNSSIKQQEDSENDEEELRSRTTDFMIDLRPGYEMHFNGTDRLSPYVGGEVKIGYRRTASYEEFQDKNNDVYYVKTINGMHSDLQGGGPNAPSLSNPGNGFFELGLNGIAGADYYFVDNLYLGAEVNFGFAFTSNNNVKLDSDQSDFEKPDPDNNGNQFNLNPNVVGSFRIGYLF